MIVFLNVLWNQKVNERETREKRGKGWGWVEEERKKKPNFVQQKTTNERKMLESMYERENKVCERGRESNRDK